MMKKSIFIIFILIWMAGPVFAADEKSSGSPQHKPTDGHGARKLEFSNIPWTGDFDQMLERRLIRVLVPYSRSLYFNDKGREMGMAAENIRDFEKWINKKYFEKLQGRPITVGVIPTTRDKLLTGVAQGLGDFAVGNLTVTEERLKTVDFVISDVPTVKEVVVTGPNSPPIQTKDDLSGRTVYVRKSSSYYESLETLNERFKSEGKPAAAVVLVPDALEDEDMMEMLNAGLLEAIVVDDWKAEMWSQILPNIKVNQQAVVRESGKRGVAVRKQSPKLESEILDFNYKYMEKQAITSIRLKQYMQHIKQIKNSTKKSEWKRFEEILNIFRKYGEKYNFDPLMLAAQGYQESRLDEHARSPSGAVGIMQLMPETGKAMKVGNIKITESNIEAASKYMDHLMAVYFSDANFEENNRVLFALASYNCGPGRLSKIRKEAEKRGYDPNQWFNNVEIMTAEKVGIETTTYVRNIFKYYVSYKLQLDAQEKARKALEGVVPVDAN